MYGLWLSSIIRAPVTLLRLATAGPLLLFQLLTLPLVGYGLLEVVTGCPVLLPQALLVFLKLSLHGSYLFQMEISLSHLGILQDLDDSEFAVLALYSVLSVV